MEITFCRELRHLAGCSIYVCRFVSAWDLICRLLDFIEERRTRAIGVGAIGVAAYITSVMTLAVMTWQMWTV